ncbi:transglutaminase-like domain-containing protein [Planctomycetes bacterium CA13]
MKSFSTQAVGVTKARYSRFCVQNGFGRAHAMGLVLLALFSGCDVPERAPLVPPEKRSARLSPMDDPDAAPSGDKIPEVQTMFKGEWVGWEAYYIKNQHVGFGHISADVEGDAPNQRVKYSFEDSVIVNRGRDAKLVQRKAEQSSEELDGRLISFETQLSVGPVVTRCTGMVEEDRFSLTKIRGNKSSVKKLDWNPKIRGLVAVEASMRRDPMEAGEVRVFEMILPISQKVASLRMKCSGPTAIPLLDRQDHRMMEVSVQVDRGDNDRSFYVVWTDEQGAIQRTYDPALELVAYRTDMRTALNDVPEAEESVAVASTPIQGDIDKPEQTRRVGYKLVPHSTTAKGEDALIKPQPNQFVREMDDGSLLVLVTRLDEPAKNRFVKVDLDADVNDSQPNAMVNYRETMVRRIAQAAIGANQLEQLELALELTRSTNRLTQWDRSAQMFPRASDVARTAEGDSAGYAVLLCALLRAKGIPSRVAFGYQYQNILEPKLVYHAWTLAYVDGTWVSLDATTGGIAAADRLTLVTSNLSEPDVNRSLIPVLDFLGAYDIEVIPSAIRYDESN